MRDSRQAVVGAALTAVLLLAAPCMVGQAPEGGGADADRSNSGPGSYGISGLGEPGSRGPSERIPTSPPTGTRTPTRDRTGTSTEQPTNRRNDTYSNRQDDSPWNQRTLPRPVVLVGRVLTGNGEPPPDRVLVKMDCGSGARPQGYTDAKGRFSFEPNGDRTLLASDASVPSRNVGRGPVTAPMGRMNLYHCHLVVHVPGYRSDRLPLRSAGSLERNDVGTIVLHRLQGFEGHTVSLTSLTAPRAAKRAYEKGIRMLRRVSPNYEKSAAHLETAVEAYPEYAEAWAALGEVRLGLDDLEGAKEALTRSIDADPKLLRPYEPLMQMAYRYNEWAALNSLSERYLKLAPGSAYVQFLAATSAAQLGKFDRAESLVLKMRDHGEAERWPLTRVVMGMVHERRAQFEKAAREYESFLEVASDPRTVSKVKRLLFEWEALQVIKPRDEALAGSP